MDEKQGRMRRRWVGRDTLEFPPQEFEKVRKSERHRHGERCGVYGRARGVARSGTAESERVYTTGGDGLHRRTNFRVRSREIVRAGFSFLRDAAGNEGRLGIFRGRTFEETRNRRTAYTHGQRRIIFPVVNVGSRHPRR